MILRTLALAVVWPLTAIAVTGYAAVCILLDFVDWVDRATRRRKT